jgi:hypothetical protein
MNLIMDRELRQRGHFYESLLMLTNSGRSPTTTPTQCSVTAKRQNFTAASKGSDYHRI